MTTPHPPNPKAAESIDAIVRDVMNLPCDCSKAERSDGVYHAYAYGHRDARHAIAEMLPARLSSLLSPAPAETDKARQDCGALWTLVAQIAEPIRKCFRDRTMPFARFTDAALKWEQSISGEGHPDTLRRENKKLRQLLALSYSGISNLYCDDGQCHDSRTQPFIDYVLDSAEEIERKMQERGRKAASSPAEKPEGEVERLRVNTTANGGELFVQLDCIEYHLRKDALAWKRVESLYRDLRRLIGPPAPEVRQDRVQGWFELSYAQYLTIPRSVLQSMPDEWQDRFVACLEELDRTIDWRPREGRYWVKLKDDRGRYIEDPLDDYNRGRRRIPHRAALSPADARPEGKGETTTRLDIDVVKLDQLIRQFSMETAGICTSTGACIGVLGPKQIILRVEADEDEFASVNERNICVRRREGNVVSGGEVAPLPETRGDGNG